MELTTLTAISAIDGRYHTKTQALQEYFSEYALLKYRCQVEIAWLKALSKNNQITEVPQLSVSAEDYLDDLIENFDLKAAQVIKSIEATTNHDVKAVEYFLKEKMTLHPELKTLVEFVHFACTSEDINNLAYALMIQNGLSRVLLPQINSIVAALKEITKSTANIPMLARTHGQSASPTTVGKEIANVVARLERQLKRLQSFSMSGKINGAVGNYNAHHISYPEVNWPSFAKNFVESLSLEHQAYTTQIEPHDCIAELAHHLKRIHTILIDFNRDIWSYISLGYFKQRMVAGEVGSSTMPHKVNPIDFENSEGNLGLANALLTHLADKLPISRWQRDLSDSTVLRALGTAFAHGVIAYSSLDKGLSKLDVNQPQIEQDLSQHWEVLAEALQTVMRRYGISEPYEQLKNLTRGKEINAQSYQKIVQQLELPDNIKQKLAQLTPADYTGLAHELAQTICDD